MKFDQWFEKVWLITLPDDLKRLMGRHGPWSFRYDHIFLVDHLDLDLKFEPESYKYASMP